MVLMTIGVVLIAYGLLESLIIIANKSKHSVFHIMEGFLMHVFIIAYYLSHITYSDLFWQKPALMIINIAPIFCLNCARLILATVSKGRFSFLKDVHLSIAAVFSLVAFPINKILGLNINENNLMISMLIMSYGTYFWYIYHSIN